VGIVYQLATVICGVGDPRQHQLLAVAETGDAGCLALRLVARAGSSRPARMAMIAMTTSSSMSVNACLEKKFHGEKFETAQ
jgi:nicotinamide mononucleotide (NMN) deamidase PncC